MKKDIVIIGGGPAGLAAALSAYENGIENIMITERDMRLGGILNQCIHNGFGLHTFREELTGPEYAHRYIQRIRDERIPYMLNSMVTDIRYSPDPGKTDKILTVMNKEKGMFEIEASAVILAMGCRERPRGAMNTPGFRGAGIYSAGTAQLYVNIEGRMPGRRVVIVGSGDIGLIMARRMTLEGAKVEAVVEIMPYSGGLKRNIVQCLNDFGIPLMLGHTVIDIHGKNRVSGVTVAAVDKDLKPVKGSERYIECDTLLYSVGLIPENELTRKLGAVIDKKTNGPVVNKALEIDGKGVFACGNVLHVHDIVDRVSKEAVNAGRNAALYLRGELDRENAEGFIESAEKNVYRPGESDDKLTCIKCPNGCELTVRRMEDSTLEVTGNKCPKGLAYAKEEFTHPVRTLTSTVPLYDPSEGISVGTSEEAYEGATAGVSDRVPVGEYVGTLSVKSREEIPKELLKDCADALRDVRITAPVSVGDVVLENVAGTGVDIVATSEKTL
ncbi:MAG: FAD-dependent oxidoreductase [Lachnospiraceae bacterium]|nr:FAD-dependent oxidoreductase [Lachnospiraceae bacterium]